MELIIDKEKLKVFYGSDFHSDFWKYGVLRESRAAHVVIDWLTIFIETSGAIWHQTFTLSFTYCRAQVGFA